MWFCVFSVVAYTHAHKRFWGKNHKTTKPLHALTRVEIVFASIVVFLTCARGVVAWLPPAPARFQLRLRPGAVIFGARHARHHVPTRWSTEAPAHEGCARLDAANPFNRNRATAPTSVRVLKRTCAVSPQLKADLERRAGDRLLSTKELCELFRCHKATIWRRMKRERDFPRPVRSSSRFLQWWQSDALAYLRSKQDAAA
jgi:predicted DNA-binding transcriptional regulator AlpA